MDRLCLSGGIRTTQYGTPSIYLFPLPGQGPRDFKQLDSDPLERVILDHFNFLKSGKTRGKVNGRTVVVGMTRKTGKKIMSFPVGFMDVTILEQKGDDESKATLFINLPFYDPANARAEGGE